MKSILLIIYILLSSSTFSQNLILNGDFEEITKCPKEILGVRSKPKVLKNVSDPNRGSFDFIHSCDSSHFPRFRWGEEPPQSGEGYVGICVLKNSDYDHGTEYIQLQFSDSLTQGKVYHFQMFLSLGDRSHLAMNKIGVVFSNTLVKQKSDNCDFTPDIISNEYYENKTGWKKYTGDYIANGGEKFLIIGNFNNRSKTKNLDPGVYMRDNYIYYFIDNVSLVPNNKLNEGVILNNVNFKLGSSELINSSFNELNKVFSMLETNPKYKIKINGHTDNVGAIDDNKRLSTNRAKSVADYLLKKGIKSDRITFFGFGSKQPRGDNETSEGRMKNRRVEFVIDK